MTGGVVEEEEPLGGWYLSRKQIEENSPSRKHGISLKKEKYLRHSYCTFLKDLGIKLNQRQRTIAKAILFCHRFFLRQSHAKNDRWTIATVCMLLACKVDKSRETPHHLKDVILVSYKLIHNKDPAAAHRIKQKEVYEQQKELILLGEKFVLATLGFDLDVQHPYEPLGKAIKKLNVYAIGQVAWNFVNDGLRTSLGLQFKPHHIAAGAIFLAAKYLDVKLPSDGEKVWWHEFDATPRQLEEISNQVMELYRITRILPSQGNEVEMMAGGGTRAATKVPATHEKHASKQISLRGTENQSEDGSTETASDITDHQVDLETRDSQNSEKLPPKDNEREVENRSNSPVTRDQDRNMIGRNLELREGPLGHSPKEAIKMIDKDKLKAALEKRRKERGEMTIKKDVMDDDDLIERELEDGVELTIENAKKTQDRRQDWSKPDYEDHGKDHEETRDGRRDGHEKDMDEYNPEEWIGIDDDASSLLNNGKRKMESPPARQPEKKKRLNSSYADRENSSLWLKQEI